MYAIVKPRRSRDRCVIREHQRDLVRLRVTKNASLDVLTEELHRTLHCLHQVFVERLLHPTGKCVEGLSIDTDDSGDTPGEEISAHTLIVLHSSAKGIVFVFTNNSLRFTSLYNIPVRYVQVWQAYQVTFLQIVHKVS